jgi:programmed cell death protein 5
MVADKCQSDVVSTYPTLKLDAHHTRSTSAYPRLTLPYKHRHSYNITMENLQPADIDPSELPEGFSRGPASGNTGDAASQQDEQKQAILQQALTPDALARLRRIKLVKKEKAEQVENVIASMAMSGKLPGQISEDKLIEMLERGNRKNASSNEASGVINIQRKNYAMDSDEEDDDDMY